MTRRGELLWSPSEDVLGRTVLGRYLSWLERERDQDFPGYRLLCRWSVDDLEGFWRSV